jgi:hypothetical protein
MNHLFNIVEGVSIVDRFVVHVSLHREVKARVIFAHCLTDVAESNVPSRVIHMVAPERVEITKQAVEYPKTNVAHARTAVARGPQNGQLSLEAPEHGRTIHSTVLGAS